MPFASYMNIILAVGLVAILATLIVPLPTILLDLLLACSISLSIAILIVTLSSREALELSTFPSLLLFTTLFRLSLNVASTRLILLQGDAGRIIQTFGGFVAGGSVVVGLVIFLILVIIQFIVITKGAERISEVSARFTLDAMPGKQMAIDADLNAGAITEAQANERRSKIVKESEFYGAMDGASKFIRGDAKAGLIITAVNIIGGIAMGYSRGMGIATAIKTYSILSIGDGLVSQIPSVIISVSSGFLVTKISSSHSVGQDLSKQFLRTGTPLTTAACIVAAMALVPGMPKVQFLLLAAGTALLGRMATKAEKMPPKQAAAQKKKPEKEPVEELLDVDRVSVHVGVRLIGMVDPRKSNAIFDRIGALRRQFAQQMGIIIPLVRLRDDLNLEPNAYEIRLSEVPVAKGFLEPELFLAMDAGAVREKVDGIKTTEPVYGLPALWITGAKKEAAELSGYTVIDPESVFITHLSETLKRHADELLTREDVQLLIDRLRKNQPSLVGEVVGTEGEVSAGLLQRGAAEPAQERHPDPRADGDPRSPGRERRQDQKCGHAHRNGPQVPEPNDHRAVPGRRRQSDRHRIRSGLRASVDRFAPPGRRRAGPERPAETAIELNRRVADAWKSAMDKGKDKTVLLCDARLRAPLAQMLCRSLPMLPVVAYDEIVLGTDVQPIETIAVTLNEMTIRNE